MRYVGAVLLAVVGLTGLGACQSAQAPDQLAVSPGDLPPIQADYRTRITAWARGFYAEPHTLRSTEISDPVLIRDQTGRLLWLVCISADSRASGGGYRGPQRQAFGFAPNFFSAPLERNKTTLIREDCDEHPLVWRAWPELQRL
jgi:hypothetical protein